MTGATYRDGFVRANGDWLHYLDWGDPAAPPVVLCHGTTANAHAWDTVSQALAADGFRVVALDARNHGASTWSDEPLNSEVLAADLLGAADGLGLARFGLVGHSMGGRQSMTFAADQPQRLSWLVIEDIAPTAPPQGSAGVADYLSTLPASYAAVEDYVAALRPNMAFADDEALLQRALHSLRPLPGGRWQLMYHRPASASPLPVRPRDLWHAMASMPVPTLLIWGGDSAIVDQEYADRFVATFPAASAIKVPDAGHAVHMDAPAAFLAALLPYARHHART